AVDAAVASGVGDAVAVKQNVIVGLKKHNDSRGYRLKVAGFKLRIDFLQPATFNLQPQTPSRTVWHVPRALVNWLCVKPAKRLRKSRWRENDERAYSLAPRFDGGARRGPADRQTRLH